MANKSFTDSLIIEILEGEWGSGDTRKEKLIAAGYDYDAVQKRVNVVVAKMKTRKEALKPWFDACKTQEQWSYNARYNWGKWNPRNIAKTKEYGTCITYPNAVAMRCKLIKEPASNILTSSGSDHDSQKTLDSFWNGSMKAIKSINSKYWRTVKYPNKTTAQLVKEGKIKEGDIIGFMGHTTMYAGKDSKGNLLFNNAGHAAGIYGDKPGSNRAVLNQKSSYMTKRKVYGVFSVNTFIVITNCSGGTITASDRYMAGQDVKITIKPNDGKVVTSLKINGKAVTVSNTYTINKIDAHYIIDVVCDAPKKKTIDELAHEVIDGKWGSGAERKRRLTEAGYDYDAVQKRVNEILNPPSPKKTIDELAREVIDGKWGSGAERKKRLTDAGYDYDAVQKRVNEIFFEGTYPGTLPTTKLVKSNAEVIADTIKWAKWIASDNRFHYGYGTHAHHNGCYFCGTQKMKMSHGILDPEFTYCCNPFVGAAWAHGGCVPTALKKCQNCSSWDFSIGHGYDTSKLFDKLGKPAVSQLKPGDVLCGDRHVALYIGNGKVVQAGHGDDNVRNSKKWNNSISIGTWGSWKRAYRFNSSVDTTCIIRHGEISKRVELWQAFLDWYYDGKVGKADGYYGDNTLKWTKKFQEEYFGKKEADGLIGDKTLAKAKMAKKK